jgi:hypothetical protein
VKLDIKLTSEPCRFCTKGKTVFEIKCETYVGRLCATHLAALLEEEKPTSTEQGS